MDCFSKIFETLDKASFLMNPQCIIPYVNEPEFSNTQMNMLNTVLSKEKGRFIEFLNSSDCDAKKISDDVAERRMYSPDGLYELLNGIKKELPIVDNGKTVFRQADGSVYEGEMEKGKKEGKGTLRWANGAVYTGNFKNGKRNGYGILEWPDGGCYKGDWQNGKKSGKGMFRWANGKMYEGQWEIGEMNGKGVLRWPDGSCYEGNFDYGKMEGKGTLTLSNGRIYKGDFFKNRMYGKGTWTLPDGIVYEGDFIYGKIHGKGTLTLPDGEIYRGTFKQDSETSALEVEDIINGETTCGLFTGSTGVFGKRIKIRL